MIGEIWGRIKGLIDEHNMGFAQRVATSFPAWITANRDKPPLTVDFLERLFLPRYQRYIQENSRSAYIFMFDGMRWDTWEAIKPKVFGCLSRETCPRRCFPLVSILPSTTEYNKYAIFTGDFPNEDGNNDWREALIPAFQKRGIHGIQRVTDSGNNQAEILTLIEADDVPVKVFNFTFIDQKLRQATQNLPTVYEKVKVNFELLVQPYLERISE